MNPPRRAGRTPTRSAPTPHPRPGAPLRPLPPAGAAPLATGPGTGVPVDLDALPDAALVLDAERRILLANTAAARLLGYRPDELAGASCPRLLDVRDRDGSALWADGWDAGARLRSVGRLAEQVVTLRTRRGLEIAVAVTGAYRRDARGALTGAVLSLRPLRRASGAGGSGAGGSGAGGSGAGGPDRGLEVVATVSHELRSPLVSVKGYSHLLLQRWDRLGDDEKLMMIGQIHHDADRVTRLIGELLDVSRLETGALVLRRQLVDLPALTAAVVAKLGLDHPGIDAAGVWPEGFPRVYADPDKIEQVLTNLVENACKYASPHGLTVAGRVGPDRVSVTVTDTGEGIGAEDLPRVFDQWFRRSEGRPSGSGLGLWISRGLIEAHGGRLSASSIVGEGSAFSFTLPLVDLEDHPTP